jgi:hypothetical protein
MLALRNNKDIINKRIFSMILVMHMIKIEKNGLWKKKLKDYLR